MPVRGQTMEQVKYLTLHRLVIMTLANGHKYIAIDADNRVCSYGGLPRVDSTGQFWLPTPGTGGFKTLGRYNPPCDWTESLMDATIITLENTLACDGCIRIFVNYCEHCTRGKTVKDFYQNESTQSSPPKDQWGGEYK